MKTVENTFIPGFETSLLHNFWKTGMIDYPGIVRYVFSKRLDKRR